jgi:hypothetical protein
MVLAMAAWSKMANPAAAGGIPGLDKNLFITPLEDY